MSDEVATLTSKIDIDVAEERRRPRLLSLLFCDFTNMTKDDKPNLLGVFDRIFVDPEAKLTPRIVVYIRVAEVVDGFVTTVFGPTSLPAVQFKTEAPATELQFSAGLPRQTQIAILLQFKAETEGVYWFDVSSNGKSLGGAALTIEYRKTEGGDGGTDTYI